MNKLLAVLLTGLLVLGVKESSALNLDVFAACPNVCPFIYEPQCGAFLGFIKPTTYSNHCELARDRCKHFYLIFAIRDGPCLFGNRRYTWPSPPNPQY